MYNGEWPAYLFGAASAPDALTKYTDARGQECSAASSPVMDAPSDPALTLIGWITRRWPVLSFFFIYIVLAVKTN